MDFKLVSKFQPTGDQPEAISQLVRGVNGGVKEIGRASCRERV